MAFSYGVSDGRVALEAATRQPFTGSVIQQIRDTTIENQASTNGVRAAAKFMAELVRDTTTVALTTYQFFAAATPRSAGLDYLVASDANANDLNDPYYAAFNLENRYINFAVNLGVVGEGAASFSTAYGALTFAQAADAVYDKVIGKQAATAAGYDVAAAIADIAGRQGYFEAVALERAPGLDLNLAAKAGLVGYVIAEAIKADIGLYARATENFYLDLTDGSAEYNVNLIGTYGPGTALDGV